MPATEPDKQSTTEFPIGPMRGGVERRWVWARAAVLVPLVVVMALVVLAGFGRF